MENNENLAFLTQDELDKWAALYSESTKEEEKSGVLDQWLVFQLNKDLYTVSMNELYEVAVMTGGTALPHPPRGVMGLINLRGETILLADMGSILSSRSCPSPDIHQRILIYKDKDGHRTGFLVDRIKGIELLADSSFKTYKAEDKDTQGLFVEQAAEINGKTIARVNITAMAEQLGKQ